MALIWLIIGVALAVAEVLTLDLVLIMLATGAFAAAGAAALGAGLAVQGLVFAVVSALSLGLLRPAAKRRLAKGDPASTMGIQAIEGSPALVLEKTDETQGLVKVNGEEWTARTMDPTQVLEPGEQVRVIKIDGATALVWRHD